MGGNFSIEAGDSDRDVTRKLQIRQTALTTLFVLQFIGALYCLCQTLVTGYCIVDSGTGGTAVPHAIWLVAAFVVSFAGPMTTRFEIGLYLEPITAGIYYLYVVCVLGVVANAIALGFFVWELVQGLSNFYTQSFGFLVATIVVTSIFIALNLINIAAARIFIRDLRKAIESGWKPSYKNSPDPLYYIKKDKEKVPDASEEPDIVVVKPLLGTKMPHARKVLLK
jgi:hypothetical protein